MRRAGGEGRPGRRAGEQAPPIEPGRRGGWIRRLAPFVLHHRGNVALALGAAILGMVVGTAFTPVVEKVILDDVIVAHSQPLAPWLALLLGTGAFGFGAAFVRRYWGGRISLDVRYDLQTAIFERFERLDFARHDQLQTGQLVSRANSDVAMLQGLLAFLPSVIGNLVMLVVSLVVMIVVSPLLAAVALVAVPLIAVVSLRMRAAVFPASWDAQQWAGEVAGVVDEAVSGVRVVKAFGQEQRELGRLGTAALGLYRSRVRAVRLRAVLQAHLQLIPGLAQVAVLALGGWLAYEHRITLGTFLLFSSYVLQLVAPVRQLAGLVTMAQQARAGAERVLDLLDANPLVTERPDPLARAEADHSVSFEDVSFGYTKARAVLAGFTLRVASGETVALVGPSGSGKSTVALLVPRFYDASRGTVRLGGVDVADLALDDLRGQIGVVFEDPFLFSDTIAANIAYGRPDAAAGQVEAAARAAGAHGFVSALPSGYETVVGERGLTLSGGQRQRIALARALLTDPQVLILDDATSSVDARTEEEIHATLRRLMAGRTTLLIAHRRSTLRLADRIAVVDHGRVVADGSHEELMAGCPLYRQLLAGPGEDCEGALDLVEAGPVGADRVEPGPVEAGPVEPGPVEAGPVEAGPVEAGLVEAGLVEAPAGATMPGPGGAVAAGPRVAPHRVNLGAGGDVMGHHAMHGLLLEPTPELLAAVEALPPADDDPALDTGAQAVHDPRFSLRGFVRPFRWPLVLGALLVVADTLLSLAGPYLVRTGIDGGVLHHSITTLWVASLVFLATTLADWADTWALNRYTGRTSERLLLALRIRIFSHLQRLGIGYYEREMGGRIMTRMTTDVEALSTLLQTGLINALVNLLSFVGVAIVLALMNARLTLITLVVVPPLAVATMWFRRGSRLAYGQARERIAAVNASLQENLSGVRVTQAYVREDRNIGVFRGLARSYLSSRLDAQRLVSIYFPFVLFLSDAAAAVVLGVGAGMVTNRQVQIGELIAFLLYLDQMFSPIQQLSQTFDQWQQARVSSVKINELMATPVATPAADDPVRPGRLTGRLRLEDVRFAYPGSADLALRGVSLDVAPGEVVALVGETGAGKSTVVKLVARFYDPMGGRVMVDGYDLSALDLDAYRHQLGYVPQEAFLFSGSVRDNIAYGRIDASDPEVEAAARAVGAHELVESLPGGYGYQVRERGRSLSAGQRQLIALARARLVDPAILLLDEATSNLDLASEAKVAAAMSSVAQGRTTLVIAHRLQTARSADRIVVIDAGRVVEQGSHDALLAAGGAYADMWRAFDLEEARPA